MLIPCRVLMYTLYIGFQNSNTGAEIWQSSNGTTWSQVYTSGFGDTHNQWPQLAEYNGFLYVGFANDFTDTYTGTGTQIGRSSNGSTWGQVVGNGFGNPNNGGSDTLVVFGDNLYSGVFNIDHGTGVWMTTEWYYMELDCPLWFWRE